MLYGALLSTVNLAVVICALINVLLKTCTEIALFNWPWKSFQNKQNKPCKNPQESAPTCQNNHFTWCPCFYYPLKPLKQANTMSYFKVYVFKCFLASICRHNMREPKLCKVLIDFQWGVEIKQDSCCPLELWVSCLFSGSLKKTLYAVGVWSWEQNKYRV